MTELKKKIHEMCPDGVPMVALGEVCDKITDGSHNPPSGIDYSSFRMISSQNIFNNKLVLNDIRYLKEDDFLKENKRTEVSQGDLLLTIVGAIGRCYVVKEEDLPFTCQRSVAVLKIKQSIILPEFVHECLININSYLETQANGAAQKGLYLKQISKIQIPLPPLPIQQRIVEILDKFTSLVSSLDSEIALRQKQYEYYRNKLLSFEEGEEGVEWKTLNDCSINVCSGGTPSRSKSDYFEGNIPWLRTQEVDWNDVYDTEIKITEEAVKNSSAKLIPENCVIIAMYGATAGKSCINKIPLTTNQACCNLQINDEIALYKYVFYYVCREYKNIKDMGEGSQNNINGQKVKNYPIPIPPLPVQLSIVRTLDTFESLLTNLKKERELRQKQYEYYREKLLTFA